MSTFTRRTLGRTDLTVGPLGLASSYGAPTAAFEEAFERGCNYFVWGSFLKGRKSSMSKAVKNIGPSRRNELVLAMYTYWHSTTLMRYSVERGLRKLGTDYLDVLILGYFSSRPRQGLLDVAMDLKQTGLVRHIGLSGHNRKLFPDLAEEGLLDVMHVRYNAVHRGGEKEIFPLLPDRDRPGVVSFTATDWGKLLKPKKMPANTDAPSAGDCYRFVLSNPAVDVCLTGPKNLEQMRENLDILDQGPMSGGELKRIRRIGDHIYGRKTG